MQTRPIPYTDGKTSFIGYLAFDDARKAPAPGVVVFPEAFGLERHAKAVAERLAALGYVALAADPYGEGRVIQGMANIPQVLGPLRENRPEWRRRATAALEALIALPQVDRGRVAAIGYCFGGTTCIELARTGADLAAIVVFHGTLNEGSDEEAKRIKAKVLVCTGVDDTRVPQESVQAFGAEMGRGGVDWQVILYGGTGHSFTNPEADKLGVPDIRYNASADARSWDAMRTFLGEAFQRAGG